MVIREARAEDATALADLFVSAVRTAGPRHYMPEQVEAWAAVAADHDAFGRRMLTALALIAEDETGPVGFATLEPEGHVGALYVRGDRQGRGIGRALLHAVLREAEEQGVSQLRAEASAFSLPLFREAGFTTIGTETVERGGVKIDRSLVERSLPTRGRGRR